jgi:hypothetical protein
LEWPAAALFYLCNILQYFPPQDDLQPAWNEEIAEGQFR